MNNIKNKDIKNIKEEDLEKVTGGSDDIPPTEIHFVKGSEVIDGGDKPADIEPPLNRPF